MPEKAFFTTQDPEFFDEIWIEFVEFIASQQPGASHTFTRAFQVALQRMPDTAARDQAFFKLGAAWVLYNARKGVLQRIPKQGTNQPGLS